MVQNYTLTKCNRDDIIHNGYTGTHRCRGVIRDQPKSVAGGGGGGPIWVESCRRIRLTNWILASIANWVLHIDRYVMVMTILSMMMTTIGTRILACLNFNGILGGDIAQ